MAAANESQGLKIAVAVFVALTVILAVTTYFGYSQYAQANEKALAAEKKAGELQSKAVNTLNDLNDLKQKVGLGNVEEYTAVKDAVGKHAEKLKGQLADATKKLGDMISEYKQAGGNEKKVEELQNAITQLNAAYQGEPNQTMQSALDRMIDITSNVVQLSYAMSLDNEGLRRDLVKQSEENKNQLQVQSDAAKKSEGEKNEITTKSEQERQGLLAKVDNLQTLLNQANSRVQALENLSNQQKTEFDAKAKEYLRLVRNYREQAEKRDVILEQPSGKITGVDYRRNEVRVNLTRRKGAREQMVFSVFDRNSPGLPTDTPKAVIELIQVGNQDSIARIDNQKTKELIKSVNYRTGQAQPPIQTGDLIYSPAFNPNEPVRFALLGKIDINRDGLDDRDDLKRMIASGGGQVAYDLPPPELGRKEEGSVSGPIAWYVIDDGKPMKPPPVSVSAPQQDQAAFDEKKAKAQQDLYTAGVRPISLERLLAMFGYHYGATITVPGRVERMDVEGSKALLRSKNRGNEAVPGATTTTPPAETPAPDAEKKDETKPEAEKPEGEAPK